MSEPDEKLQARGGDMDAPERVMVSWTTKGRAVASAPISAGLLHTIGATEYIRADLAAPDLAELVEALRWYADDANYRWKGVQWASYEIREIVQDHGERARAALAKIKELKV